MRTSDLHNAAGAAWSRLRALVALVVAWGRELARRVRPWPSVEPRPFPCAACKVEYSDARALGWHVGAMHRDVCDADTVDPDGAIARDAAAARRRRLALEELDV